MQLVTPEAALTPKEQEAHPIATGIGEVAGGLTSPQGVATIAATGGLGQLAGAAEIIPRLVSFGFGADMVYGAYQQIPEIRKAIDAKDYSTAERLMTHVVLSGGLAALALRHAATGKPAVGGKAAPSMADVVPHEADSPVGQIIADAKPVPEVQLTDTAAAKAHVEAQSTVAEAKPSAKAADPGTPTLPTARIVSEDYVPTVSKNEVLAAGIQKMIENSQELQKLGLDPSKIESGKDVTDMLDSAADHIKSNLDDRANSVLTFDMQKQLASELNMSVEDLLSTKSGQAFNAEQAVAARAILKESQTNAMNLARNAAMGDTVALKAFTDSLAQHKLILDVVKGQVAREAGRALGSFRIPDEELPQARIAEQLANLSPEAQLKAAQLLDKIDPNDRSAVNDFIAQIKPSSTSDKIFEYYRNALLSSPKTAIVKGTSEVTMMALEATKKAVAGALSKGKSLVTGDPQERFGSESYWYAKGAAQAMRNAGDVLTGKFQLEDAPGFEGSGTQAVKGPLGSIIRAPQTVLSKQTNLMYMLNYFGELNAQAARQAIGEGLSGNDLQARQEYLAHNPTEEMTKAANDLALKNTFQSQLGKFGTSLQRTISNAPLGRYLFPFFKTPINLVKASGEYSPYGLLKGLAKGDVDAQSRGLVGSSIAAAVAYHTMQGHITGGGPVDFRKKQTLEATGWQPYSVKIGGRYYSYHRAEPLGLVAGLVADTVHGIHSGDSPEVTQSKADTAVSHIMRNVNDFPFLMQASNLLQALEDPSGKKVSNFIDRQAASLVPAGVANIAELSDRTVRHPEGLTQNIESRIPGMTQNVPPAMDITGQPLQRPESQLGGINPFPISTEKNDPIVRELARLGVSTPQMPKSIKIRRQDVQLTENEREQVAQREGRELYKRLVSATVQPSWVRKDDDARRAEIAAIHRQITAKRPAMVMSMRKEARAGYEQMSLNDLLDRYRALPADEQTIADQTLMNKTIEFRKQVRRGQIPADDQARTEAKLSTLGKKIPTEFRQNLSAMDSMSDPETRFSAARHEAGHAVISEILQPGSIQDMALSPKGGITNIAPPAGKQDVGQLNPDEIRNLVATSLAGGLAEPGGTTVRHVSGDLSARAALLGGKADTPGQSVSRLVTGKAAGQDQMLAANTTLAESRARVTALLADPKTHQMIDALSTALSLKGKLSGSEVRALLNKTKQPRS